ncbi:MAG: CapA family protein [Bacillota bacterium]
MGKCRKGFAGFVVVLVTAVFILSIAAGYYSSAFWHGGTGAPTGAAPGVFEPAAPEVTISLVGDVLLAAGVGKHIASHGPDYPWEEVRPILAASDLVLGNLECAVATSGEPMENKQYTFRADPASLDGAARAGVDIFTLANNHVLDFGYQAMLETIEQLDRRGIKHTGAGSSREAAARPVIVEKNGVVVGVLAYTMIFPEGWWVAGPANPGIASGHDINGMVADVSSLREQVDFLVVSIHWGLELADYPRPREKALAHKLVDAGADLVFGHHPHVIQGLEYYKDGLIAYSAGNFIFTTSRDTRARQGMILQVRAGREGLLEAAAVPTLVDAGRALALQGEERDQVLRRLENISAPFGTSIGPEGQVVHSSSSNR